MGVARPRQQSTAPSPKVVDLVGEIGALVRHLVEHSRRVMAGEPHDWASLDDALTEVAKECRAQVPIVLTDIGDSGAR
jgi:xanthosine utilization system XapX-like protein